MSIVWKTEERYEKRRAIGKGLSTRNEIKKQVKKSEYLPGRCRSAPSAIQCMEQSLHLSPLSKRNSVSSPLKSLGTNATPEYYPN